MKVLSIISGLLLILLFQNAEFAKAEKSCKAIQTDMTKRQMHGMSHCAKTLKFKGKEKAKKMNCIIRCVMMNEHFLNEDGQTSPDAFKNYTLVFPEKLRGHLNNTMWECMEIAFTGFSTLAEDPNCSSYDPFIKCIIGKSPSFCDGVD